MMHQGEDGSMGCCPVLRVDTEVRFTAGVNLPKNLGDSPILTSSSEGSSKKLLIIF